MRRHGWTMWWSILFQNATAGTCISRVVSSHAMCCAYIKLYGQIRAWGVFCPHRPSVTMDLIDCKRNSTAATEKEKSTTISKWLVKTQTRSGSLRSWSLSFSFHVFKKKNSVAQREWRVKHGNTVAQGKWRVSHDNSVAQGEWRVSHDSRKHSKFWLVPLTSTSKIPLRNW